MAKEMKIDESEVRNIIDKLWKNHPNGCAGFNPCITEGCETYARHSLCDECIIAEYKGNKRLLWAVRSAIIDYSDAINDLVEWEENK